MKKKLALELDDLQIESFHTTAVSARRGTVNGQGTGYGYLSCVTCVHTCAGQATCDWGCIDHTHDSCGCLDTGYTDCEACTTYGYPGGGDACGGPIESEQCTPLC